MEIQHILRNYKLYESKEFNINDSDNFVIFASDNETGKTTALTAISEVLQVKQLTPEPLKRGEKEGANIHHIKDKDGNPLTVSVIFKSDNKMKFTALDFQGNKITEVGKIRELIGEVKIMTIDEFVRNCQTADGKRKILTSLIYKLLDDKEQERVLEIDKLMQTNSTLYKAIEDTKKDLSKYNAQLEALKLTELEERIFNAGDTLQPKIDERNVKINEYESAKASNDNYDNALKSNEAKKQEIANDRIKAKADYEAEMERIKKVYEAKLADLDVKEKAIKEPEKIECDITAEVYTKLKADVNTLIEAKGKQESVNEKKKQYDEIFEKVQPLQKELTAKENEKLDLKVERLNLLSKINVEGLSFDDNTFYINGYEVSDSQLSESTMGLVLLSLLCNQKINKSHFIVFGKANVFGKERMKQVEDILRKANKQAYLEQVSGSKEVTLITSIEEMFDNKDTNNNNELF